ncbi:TPA: hypothetical protein VPE63_000350 [Streptococcus pyogenes]|nr:hypothetical protein [Streptococcus pyogenes]HES8792683.1 hypothetical protein [Streptococcus pyogenes]
MQFLQKWFKHSKKEKLKESSPLSTEIEPSENWEKIPAYIPADKSDYKKVTLITSAIAAGQFKVKRILKRNPEAITVSLIASSIAAGVYPESQFRVTSIYCKR